MSHEGTKTRCTTHVMFVQIRQRWAVFGESRLLYRAHVLLDTPDVAVVELISPDTKVGSTLILSQSCGIR